MLTIASPSSTIMSTSATSIALSGTAADNVGVVAVRWSNTLGNSGDAIGTTNWQITGVPLLVGTNKITVKASGLATQELDVTIDPNGVAIKNIDLHK